MIESIRFRPCTAALIALLCMGAVRSVHAQTWTQLPDFPGTARDDAAAFVIWPNVYVGTGMEVGWSLTNDWYAFNLMTNQWSGISALPATPRQYCCAFAIDGIGYLIGGLDSTGALSEVWSYDPASNLWTEKSPIPSDGRYACVAFRALDHGYVATGMLEIGLPTSEVWAYTPTSDTWTLRAPVPGPSRHRAASYTDMLDTAYVVGGADQSFNALADGWKYDHGSDTWVSIAPLPVAVFGSDGGCPGVSGIVLGGESSSGQILDLQQEYEPYWNYWSTTSFGVLGTRRGGVSASFGAVYYGLGIDSNLTRHNDWYMLTWPFVVAENGGNAVHLHPNPGTTSFTLAGLPLDARELIATDAQGRIVQRAALPLNRTVDTRDWSSGSYLITVRDATGRAWRGRWVKL